MAAVDLKLPDRVRQGLVQLALASDEAIDNLFSLLKGIRPTFLTTRVVEELSGQIRGWSRSDFELALATLGGLTLTKTAGDDLDSFIDRVVNSLGKPSSSSKLGEEVTPALPPERFAILTARLNRFLKLPELNVTFRAFEVLTAHQKVFVSCRIFSDIRPVFSDPVQSGPAAAVVVHQMRLDYREDNNRQEIFLALDSQDLNLVADVIQRARDKDVALRRTLEAAKIPFLEPKA